MPRLMKERTKSVNDIRREKKKELDKIKNKTYKHEVNYIYNTFYKDQISALYKQVTGKK
ncbi:MAG: hypothetical protein HQL30_04530 [Candidatus Omnitrophica bacterium]|nr:hypothetical protein [Candidatus Omnitrophota bacterium]